MELFDVYTEKLRECDREIEQQLAKFTPQVNLEEQPLPPPTRRITDRPKNHPLQDLRPALYQMAGVDLTQVDGLDILTVERQSHSYPHQKNEQSGKCGVSSSCSSVDQQF